MRTISVAGKKPRPQLSCELWSINRWLRWTGFRLFVAYNPDDASEPRRIGIAWWGWP